MACLVMMLKPLKLSSVHHNPSCDGACTFARHAEEKTMRKESLVNTL